MKNKKANYNSIILVFFAAILVLFAIPLFPPQQTQAQGPNLLTNPSFEEGWHDVEIGQTPNGWRWHWLRDVTMPGGTAPVLRPESRVLSSSYIPAHEQHFIRSGNYCIKIFKDKAPIYIALSQDVNGLEVGRRYRFIAPVFVDTYDWQEKKVVPGDPYAANVRLGAGPVGGAWRDENTIAYSGWWNGNNVNPFFLAYTEFTYDFVATAPQMTVYVEFYSKWGLANSGAFMDDMKLHALGEATSPTNTPAPLPNTPVPTVEQPQVPATTPTPRPDGSVVHIVVEGDTMFGLALKYNVGLDELRRLNAGTVINDFLGIGQEIIISPGPLGNAPTPVAPQPTEEPTTAPIVEPTPEVSIPVPPAGDTAKLCLLAYFDANNDMFRQAESGEMALPGAQITVVGTSGPIGAPYVTDGINEPHCIDSLAPGTYVIRHTPPPGYKTDSGQWNIVLAAGQVSSIELGYVRDDDAPLPTPATSNGDERPGAATPSTEEPSGMTKFLNTVLTVSGVLMVLAALGVGGLFVLSRRA